MSAAAGGGNIVASRMKHLRVFSICDAVCAWYLYSGIGLDAQDAHGRSTLHLVLRLRGGMQIFVKTLTGKTITPAPFATRSAAFS